MTDNSKWKDEFGETRYASRHDAFTRKFSNSLYDWEKGKGTGPEIDEYIGQLLCLPGMAESSMKNCETTRRWEKWCKDYPLLAKKYRTFAHAIELQDGKKLSVPYDGPKHRLHMVLVGIIDDEKKPRPQLLKAKRQVVADDVLDAGTDAPGPSKKPKISHPDPQKHDQAKPKDTSKDDGKQLSKDRSDQAQKGIVVEIKMISDSELQRIRKEHDEYMAKYGGEDEDGQMPLPGGERKIVDVVKFMERVNFIRAKHGKSRLHLDLTAKGLPIPLSKDLIIGKKVSDTYTQTDPQLCTGTSGFSIDPQLSETLGVKCVDSSFHTMMDDSTTQVGDESTNPNPLEACEASDGKSAFTANSE